MSSLHSLESHPYWKSYFKYKCIECGNSNFEMKYIIKVNDDEISIYPRWTESEYCWDCEEETTLVMK
jgi:hypothetical protein